MQSFLLFRSIHSKAYQEQRKFLANHYHQNFSQWLPRIRSVTDHFLETYFTQNNAITTVNIREFIMRLVLRNSSHLLGLTDTPLDTFYDQYQDSFDTVAQYTVSNATSRNKSLEANLYELFLKIFETNFRVIQDKSPEENYVKCLFSALDVPFPASFKDFMANYSYETRFKIAMNFASVCLAGMAHSTTNNFDWALARLLKDPDKLKRFKQIVDDNPNADLSSVATFDKGGCFSALSNWIVSAVYDNPTFGHEFFSNNRNLHTKAGIRVARGSLTFVNYQACNTANAAQFNAMNRETLGEITRTKQNSSFGGSLIDENNKHTRACPAAKTSLYEQALMLVMLLKRCKLEVDADHVINLKNDDSKFPVVTRNASDDRMRLGLVK